MTASEITARIALNRLTQERVARAAGYDPTLFSRILRGLRSEPPDFEQRVTVALDRLEPAERAAAEARGCWEGRREAAGANASAR